MTFQTMKNADLNAATPGSRSVEARKIPVSFSFSAFRIIPRKAGRNGSVSGKLRKALQPEPVA